MALRLSSEAFDAAAELPSRFACEGENISPPLSISGVPAAAQSLALICDAPDEKNGPFAHWVLYDLPAGCDGLEAGYDPDGDGPVGTPGRNDFGNDCYEGPCPQPDDEVRRYYFRLYALDRRLDLPPGATRAQVLEAMRDHILAETELIGAYRRGAVPAEALGIGTEDWDFEFYSEVPGLSPTARQQMRAGAESRLGELTRGNQDLVGVSVAVEPVAQGQDQMPFRFRARIVAYIRPEKLVAVEEDEVAEVALDRALDVIERQVREQRLKLREPWK
jgi:Raf kinase inhibitor-like YbhB/YbcL family protein